ncbi:MAG: hydroxyphenylacetyl-CoA thioesterase PaaI [Hyphomicrobiales bacterium]
MPLSAQERAEKSAANMWENDRASKALGFKIKRVASGEAVLTMAVQEDHLNGHNTCHGGIIFSLADSAFGFACNSYNKNVVGQHCSVSYLAPGRLGDLLTAHAKEANRTGRTGIYDVVVTNQLGEELVHFRGVSREVSGQHFQEDEA